MPIRRLLPLLLAVALACAQKREASGCRSDSQCPSASRCLSGVCAADARPTASVRAIGAVQEFALVQLDGTASADADGDLAEHVWTVRAVDAACAPPEVTGRTPVALARFGCSGRYEVSLTVRDSMGVASEPATTEVVVQPSSAAPVVFAGMDRSTGHTCGGSPLRCRPASAIRLEAQADPGVTLRWSVVPPLDRALDANRRVRFLPDASSRAPQVVIETDGTAISGDWIFRVEAVDTYGVVGADHARVSIGNRPPVVTFSPAGPFEHVFDRTRSAFTSRGAVGFSVFDPDGDPLELSGIWRHVGDGDLSLFDGDFDGSSVTFTVDVPYAAPEDAFKLRGGVELLREIELVAVDANREVGRQAFRVEIGNRPPVAAGGTYQATAPHRYDAGRSRYVADVRVGTFVDPDGDPLVDSVGDGTCGTFHVDGAEVTAECSVPFDGTPAALARLVGARTFPVAPHDPWDAAVVVPIHTVEILNSPPRFAAAPAPSVPTVCAWWKVHFWCGIDLGVSPVEFDVSATPVDPDGDPLLVVPATQPGGTATPAATVTATPTSLLLHFAQPPLVWTCASTTPGPQSFVDVTDGVAQARAPVSPTPAECN